MDRTSSPPLAKAGEHPDGSGTPRLSRDTPLSWPSLQDQDQQGKMEMSTKDHESMLSVPENLKKHPSACLNHPTSTKNINTASTPALRYINTATMHFLIPAVALLSQSAVVFGAAVPKPAPAAVSAPTAVENAPMQAVATGAVNADEQPNIDILARGPTTIVKSLITIPVEARAPPTTTEPLFMPAPSNPFWPPFPPVPVEPQTTHSFSPQCHLETQEECDHVR